MVDEIIAGKIRIAGAMIDSAIGYNYTLPLPYRYGNTLTFSGDSTSTGSVQNPEDPRFRPATAGLGDEENGASDVSGEGAPARKRRRRRRKPSGGGEGSAAAPN